ncbi:MAG: bifunctional enoyl-CoA hydratase/phosphate acetyltransferase [Planctomycetaceae bacterium]|nr:bifunctional enoyl-CoA hydratase/phosphate acetyltransferase [Planctomycetaceae bacterium]
MICAPNRIWPVNTGLSNTNAIPNPFIRDVEPVCPANLLALAKQYQPARTAIVRAGFSLPMQAAYDAFSQGILDPVFVGERELIEQQAENLNWDIDAFEIVEACGEEESATKSAILGREGKVSAIMKGHLHTDVFMKALVNSNTGIRTQKRLFHLFHISEPKTGRALIVSDAAVNIAPDIESRKHMLVEIDRVARAIGIERPAIAILSATESPMAAMPSSVEARELAIWAAENIPTCDVTGPLAFDLIISRKSAEIKGMDDDPVAGQADAILVPDIVSGNVLFKSLVYLGGGCAAGVVLGGKVPILLTSRADPPAARLASCALASIIGNLQDR